MPTCAAPDCTAPAKTGMLMCPPCWKRTPRDLQREVNATWWNVKRDVPAYRAARDAAVEWRREHPVAGVQGGLPL